MTILRFVDRGWGVVTSSWTVASKHGDSIEVCYAWTAISGIGWVDQATGVARATFNMPMAKFIQRIASGGIIDLGIAE